MMRANPVRVLLALLLAACGGIAGGASGLNGSDSGLDSGLSGPDSGLRDSAPDSISQDSGTSATPDCPVNTPAQGSACPAVGFQCEYGTNALPRCTQIADCTPGGWNVTGPASECLSSQCPASPPTADASPGVEPCSMSLEGTDCWYPEVVCQCSNGLGGPALPLGWYCMPMVPGCPYPAPVPGSPCTEPGQQCGGWCTGTGYECDGGTWQTMLTPCPA